jgi:hypothetical protein
VTGLARECPDINRLSFDRPAVPSPTSRTAWPNKSVPSEWPITGLPANRPDLDNT